MEENYAISFNVVLDGASYSFVSDELAPGEEILAVIISFASIGTTLPLKNKFS